MIRSMSAAVTGLRGHQQKLDVIGNNIANVNTAGFKKSQVRFEDLMSQTVQGATAPQERGGINPSQVGLGTKISSIVDIHMQGPITSTDRVTDLAIEGEGFFIVTDSPSSGNRFYTRDGSFGLDGHGNLVNANGLYLCNYATEIINIPIGDDEIAQATSNMVFVGNLDADSFRPQVDEIQQIALNGATAGTFTLTFDGETTAALAFDATAGDVQAALEALTNIGAGVVTVSGSPGEWVVEFSGALGGQGIDPLEVDDTNLTDGNPAVSRLTEGAEEYIREHLYEYYAFDSLGRRYNLDFTFTPTGYNEWDYTVAVTTHEGNNQVNLAAGATGSLVFDQYGGLDQGMSAMPSLQFTPPGEAAPMEISFNFNAATQLAGSNSMLARSQDGYAAGTLAGFDITRTGTVVGTYTNGLSRIFGQIETVTFPNPEGLIKEGGNLFRETVNSGEASRGIPGGGGRGLISSSSLELSNTDLAYEFTELITTSRAFQANTRVVTTSDEVLVEVINMKR